MHPDSSTGAARNLRSATASAQSAVRQSAIRQTWQQLSSTLGQIPTLSRSNEFADRVLALGAELPSISVDSLAHRVRQLRATLAYHGATDALVAESFALVREVTSRRLGLAQHAGQIAAARIMLDNHLAEMAFGEGKTLAIVLAAATMALTGMPVHVLLADDHLAARDRDLLVPVYEALGLTVGLVVQTSSVEDRRFEYSSDVTYCGGRELALDYLRDCLALRVDQPPANGPAPVSGARTEHASRLLLRGLGMAILDDADRILLDDTASPLILSQRKTDRSRVGYYWQARLIADGCRNHHDFEMDESERTISLTGRSMLRLDRLARNLGGLWQKPEQRERLVALALAAKYLYHRDFDYVVRNARVLALDPDSGRVCGPSIWPRGLQQLIELKESCEITGDQYICAQTTYAAFLGRFPRLAGTGSALREAREELLQCYGLHVMQVPRRNPRRHLRLPSRVFTSRAAHRAAIVARVRVLHASSRAILVRTASIAEAEQLSVILTANRLRHGVVHGHHVTKDARLLARAGRPGCITIASPAAGLGFDVPLGNAVAQTGGLHVISCSPSIDPRRDRASEAWCGRRGEPGCTESLLCLQDTPLLQNVSPWIAATLRLLFGRRTLPIWIGRALLRHAQRHAARDERTREGSCAHPDISPEAPFLITQPRRLG